LGLTVLLDGLALLLLFFVNQARVPLSVGWGFRGVNLLFSLSTATVGLLILSRYHHHLIGRLFSLTGLLYAFLTFLEEYLYYAVYDAATLLPGTLFMAWLLNWFWVIANLPLLFIPLLFPDGRLPSPRWRVVIWLGLPALLLQAVTFALYPGPLTSSIPSLDNPFAIENSERLFQLASIIVTVGWVALFTGSALALVWRYRRSHGEEKQQIKWFVLAVVLLALTSPAAAADSPFVQLPFILAMNLLPVAVAHDIDIIINRTLVYGVLTAALALVYFGSVVLLQTLFRLLTGEGQSQLVTVFSTLAIAALFTPLRRRIQAVIDRRFYRRKYNAVQTLAAFGVAARDEVDLNQLTGRLLQAVDETMQPAHLSVWLRPSGQRRTQRVDYETTC
jgi:hypothetical protein